MSEEADEFNPLALQVQMCFPLYAATRLVVQAYRPLLLEIGLTYPQYMVMLALWEGDGLTVGEIGAKLLLDTGTLTPLLKRLEKLGFIERRKGKLDGRRVRSYVTELGWETKERAKSIPGALMEAAEFELDEVVQVRTMMRELLKRLADYHDMDFDDSERACS